MSSNYSMGKRRRDAEKARKKKERAERRDRKRREGPSEIPISEPEDVTGDLVAAERRARARRDAPRGARSIPSKLFVGSLSWGVDDGLLRETFEKFGTVTEAVVVCDRDTGKSRGFGFVVMEDRADAARAIDEMDGAELDGRPIVVNIATERKR